MTRLPFLLVGLLLALGFAFQQQGVLLMSRWQPTDCYGKPPEWLPDLLSIAREEGFPGFQLAVRQRDGRISLCAVGWAAVTPWPERMRRGHRMAYASLSKILTSVAALQLVQEGRLSLQGRLADHFPKIMANSVDPRLAEITIAQLLSHRAGFDRDLTPDPMISEQPWCPRHLEQLARIRLDHDPGTHYAYSNLGYCLVGAVIEQLEGTGLEAAIRRRLLDSAAVAGIRAGSYGLLQAGSAKPYADGEQPLDSLGRLSWQDMVAIGAWSGSASELQDLLGEVFPAGAAESTYLRPDAMDALLQVPADCDARQWRHCHGLAFYRYQRNGKSDMFWRDGSLPGATAFAAIFASGEQVVFLGNYRKIDWKPVHDRLGRFFADRL